MTTHSTLNYGLVTVVLLVGISFAHEALAALSRDLSVGDSGEDVLILQRFLNEQVETRIAEEGPGSPGSETSFFGPLTEAAVRRYQEIYAGDILSPLGLWRATGLVGSRTRTHINERLNEAVSEPQPVITVSEEPPKKVYTSEDQFFEDLISGDFQYPPVPSIAEQKAAFSGGFSSFGGPTITSISPESGPEGTVVTLTGTGFSAKGNDVYAGFGLLEDLPSPDGTTISFKMKDHFPDDFELPDFFRRAVPHLLFGIYVVNSTGHSNAVPFFITY